MTRWRATTGAVLPAGAAVPAAAGVIGVLLAVDVVRQLQTGNADAGLAFVAPATCVALIAAVAVGHSPEGRRMAGLIMWWLLMSVASDLGVEWSGSRLAATAMALALGLQSPAYAHMALAYPAGRVGDRLEKSFLVLAYAVGIFWQAFPALFFDPRGCAGCSPHVPSLLFTGSTFNLRPIGDAFAWIFIVLGVAFVALVVRRLRGSPPGARRTLLPLAAAGVFAAAEFVVSRIAYLAGWSQLIDPLAWVERANLLVLPTAIFIGIATIRRHRGPLGDLVVELAAAQPPEIRAALVRTLGDPSLKLALWLPDLQQYVDENGAAVTLDEGVPGRAVTLIGPEQQPLAAIDHDASLVGQRPLLEAAGSAARIALQNARLQAELRVQLAELQASRARIVAAGDAERRRLERDLHDGAQQRLLALGLALQLLHDNQADRQLLAEAQGELQAALHELRQLARGIHPAILSDRGLIAAIGSLIDRAPLPVSATITDERYPQPVESAAYFVVAEALANITKHAQARSASVSIALRNDRLIIEVSDNGQGGAEPAAGSGLQGLADRVGALDGEVAIHSPSGAGTTIHAEIPCESS